MLLRPEDHQWKPERTANQTLVEAIAKAHRLGTSGVPWPDGWQACPA
jgi:hypothetical protein